MVMYLMGGSITSQWGKRFLLSDVGLGTTLTVVAVQDSANAKFRGKKKKKKPSMGGRKLGCKPSMK